MIVIMKELNVIRIIENLHEKCVTLFCCIQRSQMFTDGYIWVSNLIINKEMIKYMQRIMAVSV